MMRTRAPVLVLGDYKSQPVGAEIIQDSARVFAGEEAGSLLAPYPVTEALAGFQLRHRASKLAIPASTAHSVDG